MSVQVCELHAARCAESGGGGLAIYIYLHGRSTRRHACTRPLAGGMNRMQTTLLTTGIAARGLHVHGVSVWTNFAVAALSTVVFTSGATCAVNTYSCITYPVSDGFHAANTDFIRDAFGLCLLTGSDLSIA